MSKGVVLRDENRCAAENNRAAASTERVGRRSPTRGRCRCGAEVAGPVLFELRGFAQQHGLHHAGGVGVPL